MSNIVSKLNIDKNKIIIDSMSTWDDTLVEFLANNKMTIFGYIDEELNIDRLAEEDVMFRIDRPENRFQAAWKNVLFVFNQLIENYTVVGFHCARLTECEITSILKNGLDTLNKNRFIERINKLKENNLITDQIYENLLNNNNIDDSRRKGMLWFFHCISTLKYEYGLYKLFKHWGGESLYRKHEGESKCNEALKNIGIPCIVLGSLSPQDIDKSESCAERMINLWKNSVNNAPISQGRSTSVRKRIEVFKVITIHDFLFSELTEFRSWRNKIL